MEDVSLKIVKTGVMINVILAKKDLRNKEKLAKKRLKCFIAQIDKIHCSI
jgi:hypothetical protein